jgi:hypothetical protein
MAGETIHIGENSPEHVAWKLLHDVAAVEGKAFHRTPGPNQEPADRKWILDTYAECIRAVRAPSLTASSRR